MCWVSTCGRHTAWLERKASPQKSPRAGAGAEDKANLGKGHTGERRNHRRVAQVVKVLEKGKDRHLQLLRRLEPR